MLIFGFRDFQKSSGVFQAETGTSVDRPSTSGMALQLTRTQPQLMHSVQLPITTSLTTASVSSQPTSVISAVGTVPVSFISSEFKIYALGVRNGSRKAAYSARFLLKRDELAKRGHRNYAIILLALSVSLSLTST